MLAGIMLYPIGRLTEKNSGLYDDEGAGGFRESIVHSSTAFVTQANVVSCCRYDKILRPLGFGFCRPEKLSLKGLRVDARPVKLCLVGPALVDPRIDIVPQRRIEVVVARALL